jgi:hypothetical protein
LPVHQPERTNVDIALLRRVASSFNVDEGLLKNAVRQQTVSESGDAFIRRADRLRRGLEKELGGNDAVRVWLKAENRGLKGKRPVEFLETGQIDVLERVQQALHGLQFS